MPLFLTFSVISLGNGYSMGIGGSAVETKQVIVLEKVLKLFIMQQCNGSFSVRVISPALELSVQSGFPSYSLCRMDYNTTAPV
jgi:hypothetical protein